MLEHAVKLSLRGIVFIVQGDPVRRHRKNETQTHAPSIDVAQLRRPGVRFWR